MLLKLLIKTYLSINSFKSISSPNSVLIFITSPVSLKYNGISFEPNFKSGKSLLHNSIL